MRLNMQSRLTPNEMVSIIDNGLPKTTVPKNIIIIGAGMAGLVAGSLLKAAGHRVKILEANNRIGGRIYTMRMPETGLYLDVGAMRIPYTHELTLAYNKKFGLRLHPFINRNETDIIYANGRKTTLKQYEENSSILRYPVAANEEGKSSEELLMLAIQPILDFIKRDPEKNWSIVEKDFDRYSTAEFLKDYPHQYKVPFSPATVEMIGVLLDLEGFLERSFVETLRFIYYTLQNLGTILGNQVYDEFISGISKSWTLDPYALGGFAIFQATQESELYPHIVKPEGRIYFAGDHTTLYHGWIQGAIESGIRSAAEINQLQI